MRPLNVWFRKTKREKEATAMPRVNLGRDPAKERQEATRRSIKRGLVE